MQQVAIRFQRTRRWVVGLGLALFLLALQVATALAAVPLADRPSGGGGC